MLRDFWLGNIENVAKRLAIAVKRLRVGSYPYQMYFQKGTVFQLKYKWKY